MEQRQDFPTVPCPYSGLTGSVSMVIYIYIFFFKLFIIFIHFWLCWVFVSVRGLPLVAASGDHSSSQCAGLSLSRPLLLRSTGSRRAGSAAVVHGPSRSAACGIFPDQGSNPCPLHWQADSQPLRHQGSPLYTFLIFFFFFFFNFLAAQRGLWDLSSPTGDPVGSLCSGGAES